MGVWYVGEIDTCLSNFKITAAGPAISSSESERQSGAASSEGRGVEQRGSTREGWGRTDVGGEGRGRSGWKR